MLFLPVILQFKEAREICKKEILNLTVKTKNVAEQELEVMY